MTSSPSGLKDPVDLLLRLPDLRHVVQHAVAEDHVEAVVRERQVQRTALLQVIEGQFPQRQPGPDALDGLAREVDTRPAGAAPDQALGVRSLAQPDLQHPLAGDPQGVKARRNVALHVVPELVIIAEELLVVSAEAVRSPPTRASPQAWFCQKS